MPARPGAKTPINANTTGRFLSIEQVAAELNITNSQSYALLRSGSLPALRIGGRGQWRVERSARGVDRGDLHGDRRDEFGHPSQPGDPNDLDDLDVTSASHTEALKQDES